MAKRHFGIVNNGFVESIFDVDNGYIVYQSFLSDDFEDAFSVIENMKNTSGDEIEVVSYGCYY